MALASTKTQVTKQKSGCIFLKSNGELCNRTRVAGKTKCWLHLRDEKKNKHKFEIDFTKYINNQRNKNVLDIEGITFPVAFDLNEISWKNLQIIKAKGAIFKKIATFKNSNLSNSDFSNCRFHSYANFNKTNINLCSFESAEFEKFATFSDSNMNKLILKDAKFKDIALFLNSVLKDSIFDLAEFEKRAIFSKTTFDKVNFLGTKFRDETFFNNVVFIFANFEASKFYYIVDFTETRFDFLNLTRCHFFGAKFINSIFNKQVNFSNCELGKTVFQEIAFPWGTPFQRTNLTEVEFLSADIRGVLLTNAIGLEKCLLANPKWFMVKALKRSKGRLALADEIKLRWPEKYNQKDKSDPSKNKLLKLSKNAINFKDIERSYREIRVNLENHKNFPDAGHFHYGEMEMRRLAKSNKKIKRTFCSLEDWYWLLSGYGENWKRATYVFFSIFFVASISYMITEKNWTFALELPGFGIFASDFIDSMVLSLKATLVRIDDFSINPYTNLLMFFQVVFGPLTLGLLILSISRQIKRN